MYHRNYFEYITMWAAVHMRVVIVLRATTCRVTFRIVRPRSRRGALQAASPWSGESVRAEPSSRQFVAARLALWNNSGATKCWPVGSGDRPALRGRPRRINRVPLHPRRIHRPRKCGPMPWSGPQPIAAARDGKARRPFDGHRRQAIRCLAAPANGQRNHLNT
jgi:hypothetical protein